MLETFYYESSSGERIDFGDHTKGIYANYNTFRDWSREYRTIVLEGVEKPLPCVFLNRKVRDEVYRILDSDRRKNTTGKFVINGYSCQCVVTGMDSSRYLESTRFMKTDINFYFPVPVWTSPEVLVFEKMSIDNRESLEGLDLPVDAPFDTTAYFPYSGMFESPFDAPSNFLMYLYGPCDNPSLTINGHVYGINRSLTANERVVVDSTNKTITLYGADGIGVNALNIRNKGQSIFEPIESGECSLEWSDGVRFQLLLVENRCEPVWDVPVEENDDNTVFLMDSNGAYIYTIEGDLIEL